MLKRLAVGGAAEHRQRLGVVQPQVALGRIDGLIPGAGDEAWNADPFENMLTVIPTVVIQFMDRIDVRSHKQNAVGRGG
ncbi:hypothetical protein D3C71_2101960 [compost metagenome]